jgi:ABC-type multidrug transport system permease subunit
MVTGFDYLSRDKALQAHWLRRFVAIVVDAAIIYLPVNLFFGFLGFNSFLVFMSTGVLFFIYTALFDALIGGTFGKMLMSLKSVSIAGKLDPAQALMRNISKVLGPLLLLDWIVGMLVDTNDPRQKWTDQLAGTSVILH